MKQLKKVDMRSIATEAKGFSAGLTIMGAVSLVVGVVIFYAMSYMGVFVSSTVKSAIPTGDLSANATATLTNLDDKQYQTFNVLGIVPLFFAVVGLIGIILGLVR